uniref:Uncharacterized protein n=1 Tax=Manihot esculenta TaxID=3983 RepID=A0A2C9V499_MANES
MEKEKKEVREREEEWSCQKLADLRRKLLVWSSSKKSAWHDQVCTKMNNVGTADFRAIDLEMTGVTRAPWGESFEFDRFGVQYLKAKDSAEKFAIVQFGICLFRYDDHRHSLTGVPLK